MMDDLTYFYDPARRHNRLRGVHDVVTGSVTGDLPSQMAHSSASDNYTYDASGNLISDTQGGLSTISWNLAGKLHSVTRADGQMVTYRYDAAGQRVAQTEGGNTTFYLRDASGNVMALYQGNTLSEHHLYGSSRLGTRRQGEVSRTLTLGHKSYELSNHLGNVMAVVSDHKLPDGTSWRAQLQSRTDYYAFGAAMPGRSGGSSYRHGLNGQEKGGLFNGHYTALYWEYDSRLGRRWNVDPVTSEFPNMSSYAVFNNNPMQFVDPNGAVAKDWVGCKKSDGSISWKWDDNIKSAAEAKSAGYDDYRAPNSIIDNGKINGQIGIKGKTSVYLGQNSNDVSFTWPNKTVTPFQVGTEWLSGKGPRNRNFVNGDNFTEMLKKHDHIEDTRAFIIDNMLNRNELSGDSPYRLGGIKGVGLYLKDYSTLLTGGVFGNLAVTYLGSFNLKWTAISNNDNGTILVNFSVENTSTMQSASRPPIIGYLPIWQENIGNRINTAFQTGWGSKTSQSFNWTETLPMKKK